MDQVAVEVALPGQIEPDVLAVPVAEEGTAAFSNGARVLDERLHGRLRALVESGEASGEVGRVLLLHTDGDLRARRVATTGIGRIEVLDPRGIDELGMGALSAVGRASRNGPRLIVLHYEPERVTDAALTVGLVGKAITFDAGGISLKPALNMQDMKGDMAGGAAVIGGIAAIADLGLPVRTIGVVAAAENL